MRKKKLMTLWEETWKTLLTLTPKNVHPRRGMPLVCNTRSMPLIWILLNAWSTPESGTVPLTILLMSTSRKLKAKRLSCSSDNYHSTQAWFWSNKPHSNETANTVNHRQHKCSSKKELKWTIKKQRTQLVHTSKVHFTNSWFSSDVQTIY